MAADPLVCAGCGTSHNGGERFCPHCGVPLAPAGGEARVNERQERARKIDPRYTQGPLVWAAGASNQVEAEFLAGMLLEEGVPSLIRRAPGFDVPDFMASGAREILVPASGAQAARDVLVDSGLRSAARPLDAPARPRLAAWVLLAVVLVTVVLFMATHVWD
jgi:hypothetical protein